MAGQRVGYKRVSSAGQNTQRQLEGLELDRCFEDKCSGGSTKRPQLEALREYVREGDKVVVHSLDRLARNLQHLRCLITALNENGVSVEFVKEGLVFTGQDDKYSTLLLNMLGAVAEFERSLIGERQAEGIALAKKRGAYKGRKRALNPEQVEELRARVASGESKAQLARDHGVTRATVYRYLSAASPSARSRTRRVDHP